MAVLNTENAIFSASHPGVKVIDLKTIRASSSFFPLLKLLKCERFYAVLSTGGHINLLVALVSIFVSVPMLIARGTNIPNERYKFSNIKSRVLSRIGGFAFKKFNYIVCQSKEMLDAWKVNRSATYTKLIVIPNPVQDPGIITDSSHCEYEIIIVARLSKVKGHDRLLDILHQLPEHYRLTIAGGIGDAHDSIKEKIQTLNLESRINLIGEIGNVCAEIAKHRVLVISSYTEGFPNVALEALSVGVPVVTFRVGGVSEFIINDFNGYIVEQGNTKSFEEHIIKACTRKWNHRDIANAILANYSLSSVVKEYQKLLEIEQ